MKLTFKIILVFLILASVFASCNDPIDRSVDNKTVTILAPLDNTISEIYLQTFWWEEVKDASQYRFQMVRNKFDQNPVFYMDTVVSKNIFKVTINPGVYQWRVYAENGKSKSNSATVQNLRVDSTSIVGRDILLTSPINNFLTKDLKVSFKWEQLPGAREYIVKIDNGPIDTVQSNEYEYIFKEDRKYSWTVVANNKGVRSNVSEKRHFTIDTTPPDTVGILTNASPINGSVSSVVTVNLSWSKSSSPDIAYYMIYIYKDASAAATYDTRFPTKGDTSPSKTSFQFTGKSGETIFWTVTAVDYAGNESALSKIKSFKIL